MRHPAAGDRNGVELAHAAGRKLRVGGEVLSRRALNSTALSSAVNVLGTSRVEWYVSRFASPPADGMTNTSKLPYRSDANATDLPSWLHTGANSYDSLSVSGIAVAARRRHRPDVALVFEEQRLAVRRDRRIPQPQRRVLGGERGYASADRQCQRKGKTHGAPSYAN